MHLNFAIHHRISCELHRKTKLLLNHQKSQQCFKDSISFYLKKHPFNFRGPRGDKQCAIQESSPQSVCPNDNRILLEGGRQNCDIVIRNVQPQDYGDWTCFVSDSVDFDNDKGTISLEVGIPATVEFRPGYVAQNNVLEVTEEDEVEVSIIMRSHFFSTVLTLI